MKLTVLGSGSAVSDSKRATSGYLIESGESKIVLDLGFGCFKNLERVANPAEIGAIFFSHFSHPDHVADLVSFLMYRKVAIRRGAVPNQVNLFGPKGFNDFFARIFKIFPFFEPLPFPIKAMELEYDAVKVFGFTLRTKPVKHIHGNAIGCRVEAKGKAVAYSGDSEYCDALVDLGKEANLLILECSSPVHIDSHLCPEDCAKIAKLAKPKQVLVSHLYPDTENLDFKMLISPSFSGKIIKAEDLMKVEV